jgi:para-aminobenzoate synthetase/4-amino-4-deoxychorismate lyase
VQDECFALLDDSSASDASNSQPRSRLYTGYLGQLECRQAKALSAMLENLQQALAQGQHAVGLFGYELGADLQRIAPRSDPSSDPDFDRGVLGRVLLFKHCAHLSVAEVSAWLEQRAKPGQPAGIANVRASVTHAEFTRAIARIRAYIEAGDAYQVNYTYRLRFDAYGSVFGLYAGLRRRQPVPYGALIGMPDGQAVLSLSPELFVRHERGALIAQPMKGTAADDDGNSNAVAIALASDPKNRAENLMITDLLRNDLGRIAEVGSVQVPQLFEVSRYAGVLQMTSTVRAQVRRDAGLSEVFAALYPCGSITGAPKHRAMQIIRELEPEPRGWYTGAIGWFDGSAEASEEDRRLGNFCLSVAIRTLVLQPPAEEGLRVGEMGVGAGIVYDSKAQEEYEECRLKARFLTGLPHDFALFETLYGTREHGCRHLERHLRRLCASAATFGFTCDAKQAETVLRDACAGLAPATAHRLRLELNQAGQFTLQSAPLTPLPEVVKLMLAPQPATAAPLFLRHKTTVRAGYDAAIRAAEAQGAFDMLFCNGHGELTEGGRTNLFVKLAGRWFTPPLAAGILPGVMRAVLLDDPHMNAQEKSLTLGDLRDAEEVIACNALRGAMQAEVVWAAG